MKLKFFILLLLPLFCYAQTKVTIVNELVKKDYSGGTISIDCDPQINALIGKPLTGINNSSDETFVKLPGYRIHAFSGNQQQSKDEAFAKEKEIKELYPDISTYVTYKAPVWRLRIGDFQTNVEATSFMKELKKKSPSLGKEMYVVTDEIKVVF
ncbi:MAG: SPOR domain-containing protein [Candidatus Azobacteroides sp.]|nr:SPOR domain-containing protein [Candidatus Azobacteroides sp.]